MNHSASHSMYYLAVLCPAELGTKILDFKYWMRDHFGTVVALKSPAHITLVPPFWLEEKREGEIQQLLNSFTSDMGQLHIQLDGFSHFDKKVLFVRVLENPALEELKEQAEKHFREGLGSSISKDVRAFRPHITIASRDLKPGDFEKAWQYFSGKPLRETFPVKTISLLKLTPGKWIVIGEKSW